MTYSTIKHHGRLLARADALTERMATFGAQTHAAGRYPEKEMELLRQNGYLAITLPGRELSVGEENTSALLQLLKLVGRGNLSAGRIYEGHINAIELIHLYGTEAQQQAYYADAQAGHLFGVWNTEMRDGVHFHERGDGSIEVRGSKSFCSGSTYVTRPIITGPLHRADGSQDGWQMAVVALDEHDPPVDETFWTPMGMQCSVSHKIDFTGIALPPAALLGQPGQYETQPHFSGGAIRFAAVHLGAAEALLDATVAFLRQMKRQGNCYQKTRVGQMAIRVESGNLWLDRAGEINDQEDEPHAIVAYANMTRTVIADICTDVIQLAERSVGSRGLMHPGILARLHTDLSMYLRQPAPDATLELVGEHHLQNDDSVHSRWSGDRL